MQIPRLSLFGAPAHTVLNDLPRSLLPAATVCDLIALFGGNRTWSMTAYHLLRLGNSSALPAAALGALEFMRLPQRDEVQRDARVHAMLNGALLPMFMLVQRMRSSRPDQPTMSDVLILMALNAALMVSASFGYRLVYRHGVGVAAEPAEVTTVAVMFEPSTAPVPQPFIP